MKQITMAVLFTTALTVFMTSSCKKEQIDPPGPGITTDTSPGTLNLVANSWKIESSGLYIQVFKNIIPQAYLNSSVNIYLLTDSKEILINNNVSFMGGQLLASQSSTDIRIVFRPLLSGGKPFDYLNIKVVFS